MLKKSQIKEIADRLGWNFEETELAVEELRKFTSIKNWEGFLKVCVKAKEPEERWQKIIRFLLINLKGDLVKTIRDLLYIDPCFYALALFNLYELRSILKLLEEKGYKINFYSKRKSFIHWSFIYYDAQKDSTIRSIASLKSQKKISPTKEVKAYINLYGVDRQDIRKFPEEFFYNPWELTYAFLNILLSYKLMASTNPKTGFSELNLRKLLIDVAAQVGFLVFNIARFRHLVSHLYYPYTLEADKSFLAEFATLLRDPDLNRNEITQRNYWLIYALVETLKRKYTIRDSYEKVGKLLNNSPNSIHRRYFDMKKEAKEKNFTLEDVIKRFGLHKHLDEKLSIIEGT